MAIRRVFFILVFAIAGETAIVWAQQPRTIAASAVAAPAAAADPAPAADAPNTHAIQLLVGRSTIVNTGVPITRVSLTSADIADALVTSNEQLLIHGKTPGTISMFVWERSGAIQRYEVTVQRDLARLSDQMRELFPGEAITVQSNGRDIVVAGRATNKDVADKAVALAAGYVDKKDDVVNLLQIQGPGGVGQVLLRVRFAEVSRTALTELAANFFTSPNGEFHDIIGRVTTQQYPAPSFDSQNGSNKLIFSDFLNLFVWDFKHDLGSVIKALQTKGLFQSLAEPNLIAENGKEASFLAGGELPIPVVQGGNQFTSVTVEWKEFGIRLNFTPTIINGDLIDLKVRPEVSTLDFNNAITLQGFRIPALSTRRAETQVQLANHQTFAIAGLMNNQVTSTLQKIPGIGDIPILGYLFQSKAAQKDKTELVVMVTPEIVPPNSFGVTDQLPRTMERYMPPLPTKKSFETPPPAFVPERPSAATQPAAPVTAAPSGRSDKMSASDAAAAVSALTPKGPVPVNNGDAPAAGAASAAAPPPAAAPAPRPLTSQEKKALEKARHDEQVKHEQEERAKAEEGKRLAKQLQEQRVREAKVREEQEKQAHEQAKKDNEAAKRQAEFDREQQKKIDEAAAKLKAAQDAYQAELARKSKQDTKQDKQQQQ